jgi:hypothetical protein
MVRVQMGHLGRVFLRSQLDGAETGVIIKWTGLAQVNQLGGLERCGVDLKPKVENWLKATGSTRTSLFGATSDQ